MSLSDRHDLVTPRTFPVWVCPGCWYLKTYRKQPATPRRCMRCAKTRYRPLSDMVDEVGLDREAVGAVYRIGGIPAVRSMIEDAWDGFPHLPNSDLETTAGG